MLNSIKKFKQHLREEKLILQEGFALQQIQKLFESPFFIPVTRWSISPSAILSALNDITINNRKSIVEFGTGVSTLYIAKLIHTLDLDVQFRSVDSNRDWLEKMRGYLVKYGLDSKVQLIYAPIADTNGRHSHKGQTQWYDMTILDDALSGVSVDMILVDGPFAALTPFARYSAVPFLKDKLASSFSVFLDDIGRAEEYEILAEWHRLLQCKKQTFNHRFAKLHTESDYIATPLLM